MTLDIPPHGSTLASSFPHIGTSGSFPLTYSPPPLGNHTGTSRLAISRGTINTPLLPIDVRLFFMSNLPHI
jgi:hypothetical protein